ncbi:ATP-binding protein [Nocardioides coralli]|uniref:ATP-binding protein n=1 Tax=Nocardioides coralli TaxID=2872154 RepID=UPI001CA42E0C|nr:ATP-binding protein [Nocardioides coralli]QZY30268.1 PAS domain S-box protein [Nocardioides coralli]
MRQRRRLLLLPALALLGVFYAFSLAEGTRLDLDVALVFPTGVLGAGILLATGVARDRDWGALAVGALVLGVGLWADQGWVWATGLALAATGEAWLLARIASRGRDEPAGLRSFPEAILVMGGVLAANVWRLAALGLFVAFFGEPLDARQLFVVAGAGIAGALAGLPPFLRLATRPRAASVPEAVAYWIGLPTAVLLVFLPGGRPELMFGVITLLAWLAFRSAMWETVVHNAVVATVAISATAYGYGPIHALVTDSGFSPERALTVGFGFVTACALCALPLSVMMADQYAEQQAFSAQRSMLNDVLESAGSTVIIATDPQGRITLFNTGAKTILGYDEDEVVGKSPAVFLDPQELANWALALRTEADFGQVCRALIWSGKSEPMDWTYLRKDGERRLLSMTISPIQTEHGTITGYLCAARDVTERVQAEQALQTALAHEQEAVERLKAVDGVKDQFVATVSHELRTPMASIIGYTEMLQDALADHPNARALLDFLDRIDRNGNRMLVLIQDLLTLSRVESHDLELVPEVVDLRDLVTGAYDDLRTRLGDRRLDVSLRVPPSPVTTECDPRMIEQVITNLMSNAVKFTPDGGRIMISLRSNGTTSRFVVSDNGLGISETDQERLFSRFFRTFEAETRQIQGSGLGLTIVQAIVAVHGGSITVDSAVGRGSTFAVELPCRLDDAAREPAWEQGAPLVS